MAYSTISKPSLHFNTKLYTGTGSAQNITGVGFQPDLVWTKKRNASGSHYLTDAVRGVGEALFTDDTSGEYDYGSAGVTAFNSDGWSVGNNAAMNGSGSTQVGWNWKANGAGSANTNGSINSTVSVNATAGFSIVKYTGTGANATVGHGLGAVPKMIIIKETDATTNWIVYHVGVGNGGSLQLNTTIATDTDGTFWNSTTPTSSVFSLGSNGNSNGSSDNYIAYCFAEKTGYSKFSSYEGNNNADGTFVYTGFKPSFIMFKNIDTAGAYWVIKDNKRSATGGTNENKYVLYPNGNDAEGTNSSGIDLLSNGFKLRESAAGTNQNTVIYMAIGQSIVGSNNVPATSR